MYRFVHSGVTLIIAIFTLIACGEGGAPAPPAQGEPPPESSTPNPNRPSPTTAQMAVAKDVLAEVNAVRATGVTCNKNSGLPETMGPAERLVLNEKLIWAAIVHSEDMAERMSMDHMGSDGSDFADRIIGEGYNPSTIGENIAFSTSDNVAGVVAQWLGSETGHCQILMDQDYSEMGAAVVRSSGDGYYYWTQVLATPR